MLNSHQLSGACRGRYFQEQYCNEIRKIVDMMREYPFVREEVKELENVARSAPDPFQIAVFGHMKTGKSSLINAFIGARRVITGVNQTTATINKITYGDGTQLKNFTVHWLDAMRKSFPLEHLADWNGKSQEVLDRVSQISHLELYSNIAALRDVNIIDTPGLGAVTLNHTETTRQFIKEQQTDAIVYVLDVGRPSDVDTLISFRNNRLPGMDPYNSLAILHKWDNAYWDNGGDIGKINSMVDYFREKLQGLVADVLPVSAPLGLVAKIASKTFWNNVLLVLREFSSESALCEALEMDDEEWCSSCERKRLYEDAVAWFELPWASFRIMLREVFRRKPEDVQQAQRIIWKLSGMQTFEKRLDEDFFSQRTLIRLRQLRARASKALTNCFLQIQETLVQKRNDAINARIIHRQLQNPELKKWLNNKFDVWESDIYQLERKWTDISELHSKITIEQNENDACLSILRWLNTSEALNYFSFPQIEMLKKMIYYATNLDRYDDSFDSQLENYVEDLWASVLSLGSEPDSTLVRYARTMEKILKMQST